MSKKQPVITLDEWIAATMPKREPRPENSFTIDEMMEKTKLTRGVVIRKIKELKSENKLSEGSFVKNGKICKYFLPIEFRNDAN
jgi:hypothetical protein